MVVIMMALHNDNDDDKKILTFESVTLLYISAPEVSIVQSPKTQVFDQGTSVSLTCDAFDFVNLPSLTWRLRDRVLPPRGRILHLPQVSNSSEGMYSCTASADNFTVRAESYVNVRCKRFLHVGSLVCVRVVGGGSRRWQGGEVGSLY